MTAVFLLRWQAAAQQLLYLGCVEAGCIHECPEWRSPFELDATRISADRTARHHGVIVVERALDYEIISGYSAHLKHVLGGVWNILEHDSVFFFSR